MKGSYDGDEKKKEELMIVHQEIDVDKFLMELEDEDLFELDLESIEGGINTNGFNTQIMERVNEHYPEKLDSEIIENINNEIFIKGRQRLMLVYLALVGLAIFLYSTGIFKELFRVFIVGGKFNL